MVQGHYIPTTHGYRICEVGIEISNMNAEDKDFTQRGYLKLSFSLGNWLRINAYPKYTNALYRSQMLMFQTGFILI